MIARNHVVEAATPLDLFVGGYTAAQRETLGPGAVLLRAFASSRAAALLAALEQVLQRSPFRFMTTPGGYGMSVAMTNCGAAGWVTDRSGYRYDALDPLSAACWPEMPSEFRELAVEAAGAAGFAEFAPDACLINRYEPGARLSLHQDKDERDLHSPIVSVSLGLSAIFLFGGHRRSERPRRVPVAHGDVVVWGGAARLRFHGVQRLKDGWHPDLGPRRINLSFRKAR
jgi:alkylated DNA repair protein (DNA oxidative demethylase)